jgi:alginate O-acetyltransferase complex protein AlgI
VIFLSPWFLIFVTIAIPLYWFIPKGRQLLLVVLSLLFYEHFAGGIAAMIPILVLGVITYFCGLFSRTTQWIGIIICVLSLIYYKYTLFLSEQVLHYIPGLNAVSVALKASAPEVVPLAISFFVFEFVHYLVEVLKGKDAIKSPMQFAIFGLFFPPLVAGPIKRYQEFIPQLSQIPRFLSQTELVYGILRIASGLIKKVAADNLTIYLNVWGTVDKFAEMNLMWRWLMLIIIAFRIYWDFSGYSDMAIGYSRLLGIHLPENFNFPYHALNLTDFWRRWHISLSTWIRDYIYIPLGGSRHGIARKIFNGILAFGLCGLWHGSKWHFAVWGLYHGVGLAVSSNYPILLGKPGQWIQSMMTKLPPLAWGITSLYVGIGWLLFFYPLSEVQQILQLLIKP